MHRLDMSNGHLEVNREYNMHLLCRRRVEQRVYMERVNIQSLT